MTPTPRVGQIIRVRWTADISNIAERDAAYTTLKFDDGGIVVGVHDDGTVDIRLVRPDELRPEPLERVAFSPSPIEDGWYALPWSASDRATP